MSDSLVTFRARYVRTPEWPAVVELLLFDAYNPRSLAFQIGKIARHVPQLPGSHALPIVAELSQARAAVPDRRSAAGRPVRGADVDGEPVERRARTWPLQVSDALTSRYFRYAYALPHATRSGR